MKHKLFSKDLWWVGCLAGAAFSLVVFTFVSNNTFMYPLATTQLGAVSGTLVQAPYLDSNGFTVFTPSTDTKIIYVSSSQGNDANDGLTEATPVKTLLRARALMTKGVSADWVLLKRGDTWVNEKIGRFDTDREDWATLTMSGRSAAEPILFSAYGNGPRPILQDPNRTVIDIFGGKYGGDHIAITSIELYNSKVDPSSPNYVAGISPKSLVTLLKDNKSLLVEDVYARFASLGAYQKGPTNVTLRRNIVDNPYDVAGHAGGIYSSAAQEFVIEENTFIDSGWNEAGGKPANIFVRSAYLANGYESTYFRRNIDLNGGSGGVQLRAGGNAENNLFYKAPVAISVGSTQNGSARDVKTTIKDNVILESRDINGDDRGFGIVLGSYNTTQYGHSSLITSASITGNVISNNKQGRYNLYAIDLAGNGPMTNVNIANNIIYNWRSADDRSGGGVAVAARAFAGSAVTISNNYLQQPQGGGLLAINSGNAASYTLSGNVYWDTKAVADRTLLTYDTTGEYKELAFVDPTRTIDSYMTHIGIGGGYPEFVRRLRLQSKTSWDARFTADAVNNYIRAGFAVVGEVLQQPPTPTPETPTPTPVPETPTSTPPSSSRSSGGGGNNNSSNSSSDPDPVTTQIGGNYTSESVSSIQPSDTNLSAPVTTQTPKTSLPATDLFKKNISFKQAAYNNTTDVRNLEQFLNDFEGESLTIDGTYSSADNEAIKRFQLKYKREILDVWNLTEATGYVGITTRLKMNFLLKGQTAVCPAFTEYNGGLSGVMSSAEIGKTQTILKDLDIYTGPINNVWDAATNRALITFQETFREVMLDPWNINKGTGYKYKTTNKFLNYFAGCDTGAVNLEGVGVYEGI